MRYKAKMTWAQGNQGLKLQKGDVVEVQKKLTFTVKDVFIWRGRQAYWTDKKMLVYADELKLMEV